MLRELLPLLLLLLLEYLLLLLLLLPVLKSRPNYSSAGLQTFSRPSGPYAPVRHAKRSQLSIGSPPHNAAGHSDATPIELQMRARDIEESLKKCFHRSDRPTVNGFVCGGFLRAGLEEDSAGAQLQQNRQGRGRGGEAPNSFKNVNQKRNSIELHLAFDRELVSARKRETSDAFEIMREQLLAKETTRRCGNSIRFRNRRKHASRYLIV